MLAARYFSPMDILNQKLQIQRRIGGFKSCSYFNLLQSFFRLEIDKSKFDKLCIALIGRKNIPLHNHLIKSILKRACLPKSALPRHSGVEDPLSVKTPDKCNTLPSQSRGEDPLSVKAPDKCNTLPSQSRGEDPLSVKAPDKCNTLPSQSREEDPLSVKAPDKCKTLPSQSRGEDHLSVNVPDKCNTLPSQSLGEDPLSVKAPDKCNTLPSQSRGEDPLSVKAPDKCKTLPSQSRGEDPLSVKAPDKCNSLQFLCKDLPQSPRKCRTPCLRAPRFRGRPPLPPDRKKYNVTLKNSIPKILKPQVNENSTPKILGQKCSKNLQHPAENKLSLSERLAVITSRPIQAPLGISNYDNRAQRLTRKRLSSDIVTDTCQSIGQLPDTHSLMKRMKLNLESEGCDISEDAASALNNALDVYLKRLITPGLELAASKSVNKLSDQIQSGPNKLPQTRCVQKLTRSVSASMSDFRTAMELNPTVLGKDWPLHLERICFHSSEE